MQTKHILQSQKQTEHPFWERIHFFKFTPKRKAAKYAHDHPVCLVDGYKLQGIIKPKSRIQVREISKQASWHAKNDKIDFPVRPNSLARRPAL